MPHEHARDLRDVCEVVSDPAHEQLLECHPAELGMNSLTAKISRF